VKSLLFCRAGLGAALLCIFLSTSSVLAAPLTLRDVIARHRAAIGSPDSAPSQSAQQSIYAISAGGLTGTITTVEASSHRLRSELRLGPLAVISGNDGNVRWEQDGTGNVRILGGEELAENTADSSFSLESYDPFKKGAAGTVTLRPQRDPATGCYILDVLPKGGTQQTVYIDAKTWLVRQYIERKGSIAGTIRIASYKSYYGEKIPSRLQIQYGGLPLVIDADLQSVVRLPGVANSLFSPPSLPKDWEFINSKDGSEASLPFTLESGEIILHVQVNGHPLRLLLDSGAGESFVTAEAAQVAGLDAEGNLQALGYGGASTTGVATAATIEVGEAVRIRHLSLVVIKDPHVSQLLSDRGHVDGALGYDLLTRLIVRVDYGHRLLTLTDPTSPQAILQPKVIALPIKLENHMPTLLAAIDGLPAARFLVDTGDSGSLHLYTQYAQSNSLMPKLGDAETRTDLGVGIGGALSEMVSPNHTLQLGTAHLSDLSLATMTGQGITRVSTLAGGIGSLVLQKFVVTFDYAHNQIRLEQNSTSAPVVPAPTSPAPLPTSGELPVPMTLEALLQKHLEALGGKEAITAIRNTKTISDVLTGGIHGTITTIYAAPDLEYEDDKLGILNVQQGYDGKTAWQRDTNGNVRPLSGEEIKDLRVQLFFDTNSYVIPGRISGKMSLRPETDPETGDYVVDALPNGGKPSTLYFDPKNWLIVKEQHLDDNVPVTTTFSDYRTVDNVRFPFQQVTTNGTTRYDMVGTVTKIENNIPLRPTLFSPPDSGRQFGFIQPGAKEASVPFDMEDGEVGFQVKINGRLSRVFLDSGASGIALSQQVATQLGLKTAGFLEARGYGGSTDLRPILIDHLEVPGAVQLTHVAAIAIDLPESLNSYFTKPLAGFVGYDLLAHFVVRIDFLHKRMTFIAANTFHPVSADGVALPIELDSDVPSVEARLDALPSARFLIDTGDEAALRLYSPFVAQYGLAKRYPRGEVTIGGGIGGVSRSRVTRIGSFSLAGVTFYSLPTDFSLDPKGGASLVNAGSLGARLLSRFTVTFDYPHSRVFFAATPATHAAFLSRTTGVTLIATKDPQGHLHVIVGAIDANSPANQTGLNTFDEVLAIDGKRVSSIGLIGARRLLASSSNRLTDTLLVQSTIGKPRTVTISVYDPLR